MKNLIFATFTLFLFASCEKEATIEQSLSPGCQEVYEMVWGKHFEYDWAVNFVTVGDKVTYYDVPTESAVSFDVTGMEDYYASPSETPGMGVLFAGTDNYRLVTYLKQGTDNYVFVYVYRGEEVRMSMIVKP